MKLTYLGTGAAEGVPGIFCNCEYCREARRLGGKDIRTRSQTLINDDFLIDLPPDTYFHFINNNIEGDKIKYLLITHSHADHLYEKELRLRGGAFAPVRRVERLKVYCNKGSFEKLMETKIASTVDIEEVHAFETFEAGDYKITALPAKHSIEENALFYIIESDKTILYAHDTGYFYEEVFDFIKTKNFKFDLISMDCNYTDICPTTEEGRHMDIDNVEKVIERLEKMGTVTDNTKKYINHFSHNSAPLHHRLEKAVNNFGYQVAHDGLCIEI